MKQIVSVIAAAAILLSASAAAAPPDAIGSVVARSLSYFQGTEKRYSVSDPWQALSGETVICTRADIPNGSGGWVPSSDFSMFFLTNGTITNMVKDNSFFGCTNREYQSLQPARR